MIDLDEQAVDLKAVAEGRSFTLSNGMVVVIASASSPAYKEGLRQLLEPYAPQLRKKKAIPVQVYEDIVVKAMATHLVRGWEPVNYKGQRFEYSPQNAETLLKDPRLFHIREEITLIASSNESFREELLEEAAKN